MTVCGGFITSIVCLLPIGSWKAVQTRSLRFKDTSDDTHLADEEGRIASEDLGTLSSSATLVAVDTLLTDTRLLPPQQERGAASF